MARLQVILDEDRDPHANHVPSNEELDETQELLNRAIDLWAGLDRWMEMGGALPKRWAVKRA